MNARKEIQRFAVVALLAALTAYGIVDVAKNGGSEMISRWVGEHGPMISEPSEKISAEWEELQQRADAQNKRGNQWQ